MIYTLLLGAFAASAAATACDLDQGKHACKAFATENDFKAENVAAPSSDVQFKYKVDINGAVSAQSNQPWVATTASITAQGGIGCYQQGTSSGTGLGPLTGGGQCTETGVTNCANDGDSATPGVATITMKLTIQQLVENLDTAGNYKLFFHRVVTNPVPSSSLKWIATQACLVDVQVSFECQQADCVEVVTIACASFAGISASGKPTLVIECKVPTTFVIDGDCDDSGSNSDQLRVTQSTPGHWGAAGAQTNGAGNLKYEVEGATALTTSGNPIGGNIKLDGCIGTAGIFNDRAVIHQADYNLTRLSKAIPALTMPVQVDAYVSATSESTYDATDDVTTASQDISGKFTAPEGAPFMATQQVSMGALTTNDDLYLRVIAKVSATTHWFVSSSGIVTGIKRNGGDYSATYDPSTCAGMQAFPTVNPIASWAHTADGYPRAYVRCGGAMASIVAGDSVTVSLTWRIRRVFATTSGKAQLLQAAPEVDPADQSVSVELTIQLGGGETTITTGAGGEGSADNTVTYIIIAVCVIAAALILAVVVVAFMCMKNRANEQLVAMSPQKCTVAAVYDISAPKKADAMDV